MGSSSSSASGGPHTESDCADGCSGYDYCCPSSQQLKCVTCGGILEADEDDCSCVYGTLGYVMLVIIILIAIGICVVCYWQKKKKQNAQIEQQKAIDDMNKKLQSQTQTITNTQPNTNTNTNSNAQTMIVQLPNGQMVTAQLMGNNQINNQSQGEGVPDNVQANINQNQHTLM